MEEVLELIITAISAACKESIMWLTVVPMMLEANIVGSGRVSEIANLIKSTTRYRDYMGAPA